MRRYLLIASLLFIPVAGYAEGETQSGSSLQSTGSSNTSSNGTSNVLQPAGGAGSDQAGMLQSASTQGGTQPQDQSSTNLQQTGTSNQSKLFIQGDGEGAQTPEESADLTWLLYAIVIVGAATLLVAGLWLLQRHMIKTSIKR